MLLRSAALVALPLGVGFLMGGMWSEIRVFYEVFPVFFLLAYVNLLDGLGFEVRVRPDQQGGAILANRRMADLAWLTGATSVGGMAVAVVYVGLSAKF